MDSGRGELVPIAMAAALALGEAATKVKGVPSVFSVGEQLEIKNSRFRVAAIGKRFMRLELLPSMAEAKDSGADGRE